MTDQPRKREDIDVIWVSKIDGSLMDCSGYLWIPIGGKDEYRPVQPNDFGEPRNRGKFHGKSKG